MQRRLLPCNDQKLPENWALQYPFCQKGLNISGTRCFLLVWDSRIQETNPSLLSIMKDQ